MVEKKPKEWVKKGVTLKLAAILVPLTALFVAILVLGFYTTFNLKGDAKGINYAGQLRYRSYKLATRVNEYQTLQGGARDGARNAILGLTEEFETILYGLRDGNKALGLRGFKPGANFSYNDPWWQFDRHINDYNQRIKPLILYVLEPLNQEGAEEALRLYNKNVPPFVDDVDRTVRLLESLSEKKLSGFKNTEFILLGLFLGIVGTSFFLAVFFIRRPLLYILKGAEAFSRGDLNYRIPVRGRDEIGALAHSFNTMAETIKNNVDTIEKNVRESQANRSLLHGVLGDIGCLVRIVNPRTHRVLLQNNALQSLYPQGLERPCYTLLGRETDCEPCLSMEAIERGRDFSNEVELPGGISCAIHSFPLANPDGTITNVMEVIRDITINKKMESRIRLLESQKMDAIGHLSSGIAHYINNPLSRINMSADVLLKGIEGAKECVHSEELKNHLTEVKELARRCDTVMKDLLSISELPRPEKLPVYINAAVEHVLSVMAPQLKPLNIQLVKELSDTTPVVLGSYSQLEAAFMNLVSNAIDAMPKGGTLTVKTCHLIRGDKVEVTISDTGPKIDKKDLPHLFNPYFLLKIRPLMRCTGLELALAQLTVQSHGGTIEVDSEEGRGTTFKVKLSVYRETVGAGFKPAPTLPEKTQL